MWCDEWDVYFCYTINFYYENQNEIKIFFFSGCHSEMLCFGQNCVYIVENMWQAAVTDHKIITFETDEGEDKSNTRRRVVRREERGLRLQKSTIHSWRRKYWILTGKEHRSDRLNSLNRLLLCQIGSELDNLGPFLCCLSTWRPICHENVWNKRWWACVCGDL